MRLCVRPIDAWKEGGPSSAVARDGYRGPTREEKNEKTGDGPTREHQKGGKQLFRREQKKGRERKKDLGGKKRFGRDRKKGAGAKKYSGANENTTHKKTV